MSVTITAADTRIRWNGRTAVCGETRVLGWTDCGLEIAFEGTGVTAELRGNPVDNPDAVAYMGVLLDGTLAPEDMTVFPVDTADYTWYTLAQGLPQGRHTLRLVKRTELLQSSVELRSLRIADGDLLPPPLPVSERRMEFIGDSITCGFGNLAVPDAPFRTREEDGWQSYAAMTARDLRAEFSVVSISGFSVYKSPYGDRLPDCYDWAGKCGGEPLLWDFAVFCPQVVVVNLGTNDGAWMCGEQELSPEEQCDRFITYYIAFLQRLRGLYPDAELVCTMGMLGNMPHPCVPRAVEQALRQGMEKVSFVQLPQAQEYGAGHPAVSAHRAAADVLTAAIRTLTGWSD